ncbi:MAG: hypothetical protein ACLFNK_02775 [Candidatus Woesearchaeota archaeon]
MKNEAEVQNMCCGDEQKNTCGCHTIVPRNFLTKEEKIEQLKEYKEELEKELKGVQESIDELR